MLRCFFQSWEEEGLGNPGARGTVWVRPACPEVLYTPSKPAPTPRAAYPALPDRSLP